MRFMVFIGMLITAGSGMCGEGGMSAALSGDLGAGQWLRVIEACSSTPVPAGCAVALETSARAASGGATSGSYLDRLYTEGALAWMRQDTGVARNAWFRLLAAAPGRGYDRDKLEDVRRAFERVDHSMRSASPLVRSPSPGMRPARRPVTRKRTRTTESPSLVVPVEPEELMRRADAARHRGHYEEARALYEAVLRVGEDIGAAAALQELDQEIE